MILFISIITPFILFVGGAYLLQFPLTIGFLYGFNFAVMYLIIWVLANQCTKILTQTLSLGDGCLILARKQIFSSFPILRNLDLQIPVGNIKEIDLQQTRIGYLLTVRFNEDGKMMGLDLDLNPLKVENKAVLEQVLELDPHIKVNEASAEILAKYNNEVLAWKGSYTLSFFVIALALVIFPVVSVMLGSKL